MKSAIYPIAVALIALALVPRSEARRRPNEQPASLSSQGQQPVESRVSPNDTARFLAGMPVSPRSPLALLTQTAVWQEHSAYFEREFARLAGGKFARLRAWQDTYLPESKERIPVVYYMFSGPDFMFVDQFFPNADVYIMCGKESMGPAPDPLRIDIGYLSTALQNLETAMKPALTTTYFITQDMKFDLQQQQLHGTIPILYVFLARADKTIRDVTFVTLDRAGSLHESAPGRGGTPGVRISYVDNPTGHEQTLFYFTTDISNGGISSDPSFIKFCGQQGVGASFSKSSSYLLFEDGFSRVREFVLSRSALVVQDDSGIPVQFFTRDKWNLRVFGNYVGPIELFKQHYQPKLAELFAQTNPPLFGIGFGYQYNYRTSNLIIAQRN